MAIANNAEYEPVARADAARERLSEFLDPEADEDEELAWWAEAAEKAWRWRRKRLEQDTDGCRSQTIPTQRARPSGRNGRVPAPRG